jgi:small-conductance mechanosensitive channel
MTLFSNFYIEVISTLTLLCIVIVLRILVAKLVKKFAKKNQTIEHRSNLVIKYIHILINIIALISLILIWGVKKDDILLTASSIATVIGVAMFAQWSILSNITSGIILFFFFPFKIGDTIKIYDKDFPVQGEIEDINAFHINLKTTEGEKVTYPNNLLLQKGISVIQHDFENKEFMD